MMKTLIFTSLSVTMLLLSGCGSDEAGTCRFDIETMMSEGDYTGAISKLEEDTTCQDAYPQDEYNIYLGVSYMGKAGLGVSDILSVAANAAAKPEDTFSAFIDEAVAKSSSTALWDIKKAKNYFETYLGDAACDDPSLNYTQQDACLFLGLANITNATSALSYLSEDISGWVDGNNTMEMQASACALEYAVGANPTLSYTCSNLETVTQLDSNVTFENNRSYELIEVNRYFYLISRTNPFPSTLGSTILTDGYCATDFTATTATPDGILNSYPCPLSQSTTEEELSTAGILIETLNEGMDIATGVLADNPELKERILTFKAEISGYTLGDVTIGDTTVEDISIDKIINYLNNNR